MLDPYHVRYPSKDGDYFERLADNASKMANPFRLMCRVYTDEEEQALSAYWLKAQAAFRK